MKNSILKRITLIVSIFILMFLCTSKAYALDIKLKDIKVKESNFTIEDPSTDNNVVTSEIILGNTGDYVIYEVTLKNNDNEKYTIKNIEDNNTNKNIELSYQYPSKVIDKKSEYKFDIKIHYKKRLENVEKININDLKVIINLIKEDGSESSVIIVNPKTGDSILKYLVLLIIALTGLVFVQKKKKIGKVLMVIPILLLPFVIFANENYKEEIIFKKITVKGVMLPYQITINVPDSEPIIKTITYGDTIGELPDISKEGYTFVGWKDQKGNTVTEETIVHGNMDINPKLTPIVYHITYNLDGGSANNKTTYTIETETFSLNEPTKENYSFSGWTGSNGDVLQTTVTIYKGSMGDKTYRAHYSQVSNVEYKVYHRKQKLDLSGYEIYETEIGHGTAGTTVRPETKVYEGFNSPEEQDLEITSDGEANITYDYTRKTIHVVINIEGSDPIERDIIYEGPIGDLPNQTKEGYTFNGYEDNNHNPVTSDTPVTGEITVEPIFTPISYNITYNLNGGTVSESNPTTYTIEDSIRLNNPSKAGYTFSGWTGSNGNTPNTNVVIENSTGDKSFVANYSKSVENLNINLDTDLVIYDGNPKEPSVVIKDGDKVLVEGTDYTVTYSNNTNAGTATVTITMTGNIDPETGITYDGEKTIAFTIEKATPSVVLNPKTEEYSGSTISFNESDVTVTPNSGGNISFKYYTDSACSNEISEVVDAGTYYTKAFVEGTDNYNAVSSNPVTIVVERQGIEEPTVTTSFTYNGLEQTLMSDTNTYTVSNNISKNAGEVNVIVTPKDNYKWEDGTTTPKTVTITIEPYDISLSGHSSVVPIEEYTYDGTAKEPTPSVIVPLPTSIITTTLTSEDIDYSYENNVNAGNGKVNITGKGNYIGTISENFVIGKANGYINLTRENDNITYGTNSISVGVENASGIINASTTNPTATVSVSGNTVEVSNLGTISSGTTVTVVVKALESVNYTEAEAEYKVTISNAAITGGNVTITGDNGVGNKLTAVVEDTTPVSTYTYQWYRNDSDSVSGGTAIEGATNNEYTLTNNDVGKYIYVVVTAEKENYTPITFSDKVDDEHNKSSLVHILVEKPTQNNYCKEITYNGDSQVLTNESGEGYAFINNSGTNAGTYEINARLDENYMWSDYTTNNSTITCSINKRNITVKADNQEKIYDGEALNADNTCSDVNNSLVTGHSLTCTASGSITNAGEETKTLGTVNISYGQEDLTSNYNITKQNGTLTITKANSVCQITNNPVIYYPGDNTASIEYLCTGDGTLSTSSNSNTINVSDITDTSATLTSTSTGTSVITLSKTAGANYNGTTVTKEITVEPSIYHVVFNKNSEEATGLMDPQDISYGIPTNLSSNEFLKNGSTFIEWNTKQDWTGTSYQDTSPVTSLAESGNFNLFAQWSYYLTYDFNVLNNMNEWNFIGKDRFTINYDESTQINDISCNGIGGTWENVYIPITTVVGESYTLEFDYINEYGYNNYSSYPGIGMQILKAVSNSNNSSNQITVTYLSKEANPDVQHIVVTFIATQSTTYLDFNFGFAQDGEVTNVKLGNFKLTKYLEERYTINNIPNFVLGEGISGNYYTESSGGDVLEPNTTIFKDQTYYASIHKNKYTIKFDKNENDVTGEMSEITVNCGDTINLPISNYIKSGYSFVGWNTKADGTGTSYLDKASITNLSLIDNDEITLYAQWIQASAMFNYGSSVKNKMVNLAGNASNIQSIEKASTKPDTSQFSSTNIVSISNSTYYTPIYMWYENNTIYWYSDDNNPKLNENSNEMFYTLSSLESVDVSSWDSSNVTTIFRMFQNCSSLQTLDLSTFDTSNVTDMRYMFAGCTSLEDLNVTSFDTSNVTKVEYMFQNCSSLSSINVSSFELTKPTTYFAMFYGCSSLTSIDISSFKGGAVINTDSMFMNCSNLELANISNLDLSNATRVGGHYGADGFMYMFNSEKLKTLIMDNVKLSNNAKSIITSNEMPNIETVSLKNASGGSATTLSGMFKDCVYLKNVDFTGFDLKNVTNISELFSGCNSLITLDLSGLNTSNVTNMKKMFYNCNSIETLDLSNFNTSNVTDMSYMFSGCNALTNINLSSFDTRNVTTVEWMFSNCNVLPSIDLSNFELTSATTYYGMFYNCYALTDIDLSSFKGGEVKDLDSMFYNCNNLERVDLSNMDLSKATNVGGNYGGSLRYMFTSDKLKTLIMDNVKFSNNAKSIIRSNPIYTIVETVSLKNASGGSATSLSGMFEGCTNLKNIDMENFDFKNVTDITGMFRGANSLTSIDLSTCNTSSITNMDSLFYECKNLQSINLSNFNTNNVTDMDWMFYRCYTLETLDLSSFNTQNLTNMDYMFFAASNLTTIYASDDFVTTNVTHHSYVFSSSTKIVGGVGTVYNSSKINKEYARIDKGTIRPGYFTAATGWRFVNSQTSQSIQDQEWSYYEDGVRVESGWRMLDDFYGSEQKYYFANGICYTGWLEYQGDYYYLSTVDDDGNGYLDCGAYRNISKVIDGKSYAFDSEGRCLNYDGPDMYTIRFDSNGGTASETLINLGTDEPIGTLPTASREGYVFNGWWTDIAYGTQISSATVPNAGVTYYAHWIKINTVTFDSTDGEFSPNVTTNTITYSNTYMGGTSYIEPYRSGYIIVGWNTEEDGTGTSYSDEQDVLTNINSLNGETLYAQWIVAQAMFDTGSNVNVKMKKLAGNSSATSSSNDTNITSIQKSSTKPDLSTMTIDNIVSTTVSSTYITSNTQIYMWFDNGTIYWWSEDSNPSFNQNSSYMFADLQGLTLLDLSDFNTNNVTDMNNMFFSCANLTSLNLNSFNTGNVTNMYMMFYYNTNLNNLDLSSFDTSNVTNMGSMFIGCSSLTSIDLGNNFNTENVTSMDSMFRDCTNLTSINIGNKFDTSNVTTMSQMFYNCNSLTNLDLGNKFDTSVVTIMDQMFYNCSGLTSLDLGNNFNTHSLISLYHMFSGCSSLRTLDLGDKFVTNNVTSMWCVFMNCSNLTTIYTTNSFVIPQGSDSTNMFYNATKLVGGMGTLFNSSHIDATYAHIDGGTSNPGYFTEKTSISIVFDSNGGTGTMNSQTVQYNVQAQLDTNQFTKSGFVFNGWNTKADGTGTSYTDGGNITATSYIKLYAQWREIVAIFDTGQNVNVKMKKLAGNSSATYSTSDTNITSIQKSSSAPDISTMTNDNIVSSSDSDKPIYMWYDNGTIYWWSEINNPMLNVDSSFLFATFRNLVSIDLSSFNTSNVTNMLRMFFYSDSLPSLDLSSFDTSNVTNMQGMFNGSSSLPSLDLSSFDTSSVEDMSSMFAGSENLVSINLSSFNTGSVIDMSNMFSSCKKLTTLNLSNFDTSNVTNMQGMFNRCSSLTSLDLSSLNTSNVTNMQWIFDNCYNLETINLRGSFSTSNVTNMSYMFASCRSLKNLDLSNFNTSNVTNMSGMFNYCSSLTSLDLSNFNTSSVITMKSMFSDCVSLSTINLNSFNTNNVNDMSSMFYRCLELTSLNLDNFNTSKVQTMKLMFNECKELTSLDLSSFVTNTLRSTEGMFMNCSLLQTIYVSNNFVTTFVTDSSYMFSGCNNLVGEQGTTYNSSNPQDITYAHVDGGTSNPGYFTYKAAPSGASVSKFINRFKSNNTFRSKIILLGSVIILSILGLIILFIRHKNKKKIS